MHVSLTYKYALWCSFAYSVLVGYLASWFQLLHIQAQLPEGLTPQGLDREQFVPDYPNEDQGAVESVDLISFAYQIASGMINPLFKLNLQSRLK